ncbi:hypothetical protein SVAN01_11246 [Stagonosporopsis vannaccii]|nr:hypothetical protein SVAN01_11246 [Stagonosporopsis vannaccii]
MTWLTALVRLCIIGRIMNRDLCAWNVTFVSISPDRCS